MTYTEAKNIITTFETAEEQTDELIYQTLELEYTQLRNVKNQTREICSFAIRQNPLALKYVKDQTLGLCVQALVAPGLSKGVEDLIRDEAMKAEALKWKQEKEKMLDEEFKAFSQTTDPEEREALADKLSQKRIDFMKRVSELK